MSDIRSPRKATRYLVWVLVALAGVLMVACMAGCRATDVLTEIIYDQTSEDVDLENENKFIINDSSSDIENLNLASQEISDDAPANEEEQNLLVYSSKPNTRGFHTKPSVFSMTPDFTGLEASVGVTYHMTQDKDALKYEVDMDELEEDALKSVDTVVETAEDNGSTNDDEEGDAGTGGTGDSGGEGDLNSNGGSGTQGQYGEGGSNGGTNTTRVKSSSRKKKPKTADHVAAFGSMAVIVQAVGGKGALVGADKTTLKGDGFTTVFADEGVDSIKTVWTGDGSTLNEGNFDVDALINSGATLILDTQNRYDADHIGSSAVKKLNEANITVQIVYTTTDSENLLAAVDEVGKIFANSTINNQDSTTNASTYEKLHDEIVEKAQSNNGSGKLASSNGKQYEGSGSTLGSSKYTSDADYTLLIDGYDANATYSGSTGSFSPKSDGALLATLGYNTRSTSYYMQVGGVINTAATRFVKGKGQQTIVWQFNTNTWNCRKQDWNNLDSGVYFPDGAGWRNVLLTTGVNDGSGGSNDGIGAGNSPGSSFGTSTFPKVITTTSEAKEALITNSQRPQGLYTPYPWTNGNGSNNYFGVNNGSTLITSCIGADGANTSTTNALAGGITDSNVVVNPCGLVSSWTDGDSMESVLEAAWINDEVNTRSKGKTGSGWWSYVEDFYKQVYRFDDVGKYKDQITRGDYAD